MRVTFFTLVTTGLFLFLTSCGRQSKEESIKREKHIVDSVVMVYQNKIIADSLEKLKKETDAKFVQFLTEGDSLFFLKNFDNAKEKYQNALNFSKDENNTKILEAKISDCDKKKEVENLSIAKVEQLLLGKKIFGIQFIWDGYGSAMVTKESGVLKISGSQFSKDKIEYCKLNGYITIVDERKIIIKGNIQIFTKDCCGIINKNGEFTFAKTGSRKYWRLQEFNQLCSQYTCAYYLDIFE